MDEENEPVKRCGVSFETLADYHEGRADASLTAQVRQHLDRDCSHCRQNLAWLERAKSTLWQAHTVQVPEPALERARALFRERFQPVVVPNPLVSWLARLQFDSRSNTPALAGARGATGEGVQLVYSTDVHDIDLFQEPSEAGTWYVIGQVMPRDGEATLVPHEIVLTEQNGNRLTFAPTGGEFHLPSVPEGIYDIALRLTDGEITLPGVGIGQ